MSTIKDQLKQRRSIRKYTIQPVPDRLILEALEAASWAPSAHNAQPWRFILVSDIEVKQSLAKTMAEAWIKDQTKDSVRVKQGEEDFSVRRFSTAPVVIVACLSFEDVKQYVDDKRRLLERDLAVQSLGASVQNLLLSASGNGLGACWFSAPMFCKDVVRQVLGVPENVEPQAIILMGYSNEKPIVKQRKTFEEFCFQNRWNKPI
ncbi:MAG: nitroreductase family protein [Candidatus Bathyarchaeota archaeon]|nr:nitroreductase family protein [Candidatus Termiticorpusculum sp.]